MANQIKTKEEFFERMYESFRTDDLFEGVTPGKYDGEDFLIVDSWETLTRIGAIINGYEGNLNLPASYCAKDLNKDLDRAATELEKTLKENPEHLGTISRLETKIKQLNNLSTYLRWLHTNEVETISLDDLGIEAGFSDEYSKCCGGCNGCENIVRTSPDSYSWSPPLFVDCEGYACDECAKNYSDYVLEEYKNVQKSIPDQFDTAELGLVKINEETYQNGFHRGMDDSPEPIIKSLNEADIDVWFIVHPSQFYCEFDVYVKTEDEDRAREILNGTDTYQGYSTAGNLERGLKEASKQMGELSGDGIKYAKVNTDGTAETRLVSSEEFIKGIKD